jgi:hypothetical protein
MQEDIDALSSRVDSLEKRQGYVETKVEVQEVTYDTVDTRSINEKISSM